MSIEFKNGQLTGCSAQDSRDKAKELYYLLNKLPQRYHQFACDLISKAKTESTGLSLGQMKWVLILIDRAKDINAAPAPVVLADNLQKVIEVFDTAATNLKWPRIYLRYEDTDFVLARNSAGKVNVQTRGSFENRIWFGAIERNGKFIPSRRHAAEINASILPLLKELAADPLATAKAQGQKYGTCCLCGRELTNAVSIELGIGPICADKFGF